jgi:acylphosphatase
MTVRAHVTVTGRVQGVFYRTSTMEKARDMGVSGWVRNLRDGRVEAVFEGEPGSVKEMVAWCRIGPPGSSVKDVQVSWGEQPENLKDFKVVY